MSASLRAAEPRDAYPLWVWANDPATRLASGGRPEIDWETHIAWLAARLSSPAAMILILESGTGQPLGTIRFETADDWRTARLSYGLAAEARGQGHGAELLGRGTAKLLERYPDSELYAEVEAGNGASRHLFDQLGWRLGPGAGAGIRFVLGPKDSR
jgi:RimJ/RimL family protein N-acetyltransferase